MKTPRHWSPLAFRIAGIASILSAVTTLILILGPSLYPAPNDLDDRISLLANPWFQLRSWSYYAHPFLVFAAALGVWRVASDYDAGIALFGIAAFGVWAYSEALQQALVNVAAGWNWFPAYGSATESQRLLIAERWSMFEGLWDGLYFLLLTGFLFGTLCFGLALRHATGGDRLVGRLFLALSALTALTFLAGYGGPAWTDTVTSYSYPLLQPAFRAFIGIWLWRKSCGVIAAPQTAGEF